MAEGFRFTITSEDQYSAQLDNLKTQLASLSKLLRESTGASAEFLGVLGGEAEKVRADIDELNAAFARFKAISAGATAGATAEIEKISVAAQAATVSTANWNKELRHIPAAFDSFAAGRRGQLFATFGAAIRDANLGIAPMLAGIVALSAVMGGAAIIRGTENMGKWATDLRESAAAANMTIAQMSQLQGVLELTGKKADSGDQALKFFARTLATAYGDPTTKAANSLKNLGFVQDELNKHGTDTMWMLNRLAELYYENAGAENLAANMAVAMGRSWQTAIPWLENGSESLQKSMEHAKELGITLNEDTDSAIARTAKAANDLAEEIKGHAIQAFIEWGPQIRGIINLLSSLSTIASEAANAVSNFGSVASHLPTPKTTGGPSEFAKWWHSLFGGGGEAGGGLPQPNVSGTSPNEGKSFQSTGGVKILPPPAPDKDVWRGDQDYSSKIPKGRGGVSGSGAADLSQQRELAQANLDLELQQAQGNAQKIGAAYDKLLSQLAALYGKDSAQYIRAEANKIRATDEAWKRIEKATEESLNKQADSMRRAAEEQKRLALEVAKANEEAMKPLGQAIDSVGSAFTKFFNSEITGAERGRQAIQHLTSELEGQLLSAIEKLAEKIAVSGLSKLLGVSVASGGGLGDLIAGGVGALFGFSEGGIVPSAAGGFLAPNFGRGGQLSILHPQEMVLPANISTGLQSMIQSNTTANLTYAPQLSGGGAFATRAQAETFFRQHGDVMMGQARNMIRNGFRP